MLRAAAEEAGCEAVLALAEVKETWDTEPGRRGRGVDLTYIITSELTLSWWTGVAGGEPVSLYVPEEQVCASAPSADLRPYDSEYTGYMGNYGNTMDRWYRRAAVVVWPRQHAFVRERGDDVLACLLPMLRAAEMKPGTPFTGVAARRGPTQARQEPDQRCRAAGQARGLEVRQPAHAGADHDQRVVPERG